MSKAPLEFPEPDEETDLDWLSSRSCSVCDGTGQDVENGICPHCKGTGVSR